MHHICFASCCSQACCDNQNGTVYLPLIPCLLDKVVFSWSEISTLVWNLKSIMKCYVGDNTMKEKLVREVKDIFRTPCVRHRRDDFLNCIVGRW